MVAEIGLGRCDIHDLSAAHRACALAGGGAKQHEQKREAESQRQGERTKTRVEKIQELHIRMNLHYKPGRLREETIDLSG
jgi:hypothetical protein